MARVVERSEIDPSHLQGLRVAVLGYGSQGRAQALNLRDSGVDVRVGTRAGTSFDRASEDGWAALSIPAAVEEADLAVFCLPDVEMSRIYAEEVLPHLPAGATLVFAHGFAIHYGLIQPRATEDVILVAPMGPGPVLRQRFEEGSGVPALVAIHQDPSGQARRKALAYGAAIGSGRVAMLETSFQEETESDLFGEQAVLCGGLPSLILAAFETLTAGGISPEIAYIACLHEVKLIADLMYAKGLDGMAESISSTAEWGGYEVGPAVIGEASRKRLENALRRVQSGAFAKEWIEESATGGRGLRHWHDERLAHPINEVGRRMREVLQVEA